MKILKEKVKRRNNEMSEDDKVKFISRVQGDG